MSYYSQENHGPYELFDLGDLKLRLGGVIPNCQLAYSTLGTLNPAKDNVVLITTWWSGTSKIMEQVYTGAGRALDPAHHFIIIANQLGCGIGTSPNTAPAAIAKGRFPALSIADDVAAQHRLVTEKFGIQELALVFGGSMGAQQSFEWAVRHPAMVKRAAALAGTAKCSAHCALFAGTLADALRADPHFNGGDYQSSEQMAGGLNAVAGLMAVTGWCGPFYEHELWKPLGFESVDAFVMNFMRGYFGPMDPNVLIGEARKWQGHDVAHGGDLAAALRTIKAKVLIMQIENDLMFPLADCERDHKMIPGSQLRVIRSHSGHLGLFAIEPDYSPQFDTFVRELLAA